MNPGTRIVLIATFFATVPVVVWLVGETVRGGPDSAFTGQAPMAASTDGPVNQAEGAMYQAYPVAMTLAPAIPGARRRTLRNLSANRAYAGAPPTIPHPIDDDGLVADDCMVCHENGGYAPTLRAYAPITPHPTFANCRQCHVPQVSATNFRGINWQEPAVREIGRRALPTSPLVMPHGLQLRENCQACHTGPAAVAEIRTTHPERVNCRQCHVPQEPAAPFPPQDGSP